MASLVQFRRDTTVNWEAANPVLALGELGVDITEAKFKLGNGADDWNTLEYSTGPAGADGIDGIDGAEGPSTPSANADNELVLGTDDLLYFNAPEFTGAGSTGYVPDSVTEQNTFLKDDGTWTTPPVSPVGGTAISYTWDSTTTATAPISGDIKVNNVDQTIATEMYVSNTSRLGNDVSIFWQNQTEGDYIGLWEDGNQGNESDYYLIVGPVVDNGTWFTIPIDFRAGTGGIDNNKALTCFFLGNPTNQLPVGGTTAQVLAKASDTDFDTAWADIDPTNLTWTAGTTSGPVINSSTGTGQAIPLASGTASGVLSTTIQKIAGTKTFSSAPLVPAGASGEQVPQAQEVVGSTAGDYGTGTDRVLALVSCTQAEYDALTPTTGVMYAIVG